MLSWPGMRRIMGVIVGAACGLFLALRDDDLILCEIVLLPIYGAFCGIVLAKKMRDARTARNIVLAAFAGSVLHVVLRWLSGKADGSGYLRAVVDGAAIGAIIGSEPQKAVRGAKIGGAIGLGVGLLVGAIGVMVRNIPMSTLVGVQSLEITAPMYVLLYAGLGGAFFGALIGAFIKVVPSL